jgi:uncharacterized protein YecE (DUF72 family)
MLRKQRIGWVVADTAGRWPEFLDVTTDFVYVRLHGATELYNSSYSDAEIERWAIRIARWRAGSASVERARIATPAADRRGGRDVFCYFDNTDKVHAPHNARRLLARLGMAGAGAVATPRAPVKKGGAVKARPARRR